MHHFSKIRLSMFAASLGLLAGCATQPAEPTLGDAMRQHSAEQQRESEIKRQLAKDWERGVELIEAGSKKVERGQERIDKAETQLEKGTQEVEQGTREIAEGRQLKAESERRFRARFPDLELDPAAIDG